MTTFQDLERLVVDKQYRTHTTTAFLYHVYAYLQGFPRSFSDKVVLEIEKKLPDIKRYGADYEKGYILGLIEQMHYNEYKKRP